MTQIDLQPVVMAGGSGTRLWPLSRAQFPKQFLVLNDNRSLFQQAAGRLAAEGSIAILGVQPDRPETGYGYINASGSDAAAMRGERVVEKPDLATARRFLADGHYFWNSGMFVVRASVWLAAIERFRADIVQATRKAWDARQIDASFVRPGCELFAAIPSESIDDAVMEPVSAAPGSLALRMVPLAAGWNDLGAWESVWQVSPKDEAGHATRGDAVPVAERSRSQEVKQIVAELDRAGRAK